MAETIYVRDEAGCVQAMDLPLHPAIAERVRRGDIVRVANMEGDPWVAPAPLPEVSPEEQAANHAELLDSLGQALDNNESLTAELADVTAQRDALTVELGERVAELADITAQRDALAAELEQAHAAAAELAAAKPAPAKTTAKKAT